MKGKYDYTNSFNKKNYKMYPFRVRKDDQELIMKLENIPNRNKYISSLIRNDLHPDVLTIKQIRTRIKPVMDKHGIKEVYLFGSYARGEAKPSSDVDIYCEDGDIRTFADQDDFEEELKGALGKDVDIVFMSVKLGAFFKSQLMEDRIKIWLV